MDAFWPRRKELIDSSHFRTRLSPTPTFKSTDGRLLAYGEPEITFTDMHRNGAEPDQLYLQMSHWNMKSFQSSDESFP